MLVRPARLGPEPDCPRQPMQPHLRRRRQSVLWRYHAHQPVHGRERQCSHRRRICTASCGAGRCRGDFSSSLSNTLDYLTTFVFGRWRSCLLSLSFRLLSYLKDTRHAAWLRYLTVQFICLSRANSFPFLPKKKHDCSAISIIEWKYANKIKSRVSHPSHVTKTSPNAFKSALVPTPSP